MVNYRKIRVAYGCGVLRASSDLVAHALGRARSFVGNAIGKSESVTKAETVVGLIIE